MQVLVSLFLVVLLVVSILIEGLHVDSASKPHPPHQEYYSPSASNLTYAVSASTTSVSGVQLSTYS